MLSSPTIDMFLTRSATWSKMDGRNFLVRLVDDAGDSKDYGLPLADAKAIHHDLPAILLTRLEVKTKSRRMDTLNGEQIRDTAHLLKRGAVQILGANGTLRFCTGLSEIVPGSCSGDLVWLHADVATVIYGGFVTTKTRIEDALRDISNTQPFVLRSEQCRFATTQEHLNSTFPGWRERLRMTKTANMEPSVWLSSIFVLPLPVVSDNDMDDYGMESKPLTVEELRL